MPKFESISRHTFIADELVRAFPPKLKHPNKKAVFEIACPPGAKHLGSMEFSRWPAIPLPESAENNGQLEIESREDIFGYEPQPQDLSRIEWYLNFADANLLGFYGGQAFAQDEIQVAEHPALASLRVALPDLGHKPYTVENGAPTPVLVMGVERRCAIATDKNAAEGRPQGLYGRLFAATSVDVVKKAVRPIVPPTRSNVIAIEAPSLGSGAYSKEQIGYILQTAFTGFSAARQESVRSLGQPPIPEVVIHTGFWGCGAFGGNRILMTVLQIVAARLAGVRKIVFHTVDSQGSASFERAKKILASKVDRPGVFARLTGATTRIESEPLNALIDRLEGLRFEWGVSDGN